MYAKVKVSLTPMFCLIFISFLVLLSCETNDGDGLGRERERFEKENSSNQLYSFLLITIDTWRSDYIGVSKSGKVETPNLDRLAGEGVYEKKVETPCPLTTPAHATILTGLLPLKHKILDVVGFELPKNIPTLAEEFEKKSYGRAAFISSVTLHKKFGLNRGFEIYDMGSIEGNQFNSDSALPERDGGETTASFINYLKTVDKGKPIFAWVHYYDSHWPYKKRAEYEKIYPGDPYAAQVAFVDCQIGRVLAALKEDESRKWRILIVGDHGEGLGDHGERRHGMALYTETLDVPMILWPKPDKELKHKPPYALEDIYPTVLEWMDLGSGKDCDGESLFLSNDKDRELPVLTVVPSIRYGIYPCLGLRKGNFMYLSQGEEELYDLSNDSDEKINLAKRKEFKDVLNRMRESCNAKLPFAEIQKCLNMQNKSRPEELKQLESLGYLSGGDSPVTNLQKVNIQEALKYEAIMEDVYEEYKKDNNLTKLKNAYEKLLTKFPNSTVYSQRLGITLLDKGYFEGAERAFKKCVAINPENYKMLINLAGVEIILGKIESGRVLYEKALEIEPDDPVAHKNLGTIYAKYLNNPQKAIEHYRKYLEIAPDSDAEIIRNYILNAEK